MSPGGSLDDGRERVRIRGEFITLGQFLKLIGAIGNGAEAKMYLSEYRVLVDDFREDRRGRKLRDGDTVTLPEGQVYVVVAESG